jgi:hypothetical protein
VLEGESYEWDTEREEVKSSSRNAKRPHSPAVGAKPGSSQFTRIASSLLHRQRSWSSEIDYDDRHSLVVALDGCDGRAILASRIYSTYAKEI